MTYRDRWRPIIAKVIAENPEADQKVLRAALRAAWPKRELRSGWPYKVWLDEIARQTGRKPKRDRKRKIASSVLRSMNAAEVKAWFAKRQMKLFEEQR